MNQSIESLFKLLDEPGSWAIRKEGDKLWIEESGFIDRIPSMHPPMTFLQSVEKLHTRLSDPKRKRMPPLPYLDCVATEGCKTTKSHTDT